MIHWKSAYSEILKGEIQNSAKTMTVMVMAHRSNSGIGSRIMGESGTPVEITLSHMNDSNKLGLMSTVYQYEHGGQNPYAQIRVLLKEHNHIVIWDPAVTNR